MEDNPVVLFLLNFVVGLWLLAIVVVAFIGAWLAWKSAEVLWIVIAFLGIYVVTQAAYTPFSFGTEYNAAGHFPWTDPWNSIDYYPSPAFKWWIWLLLLLVLISHVFENKIFTKAVGAPLLVLALIGMDMFDFVGIWSGDRAKQVAEEKAAVIRVETRDCQSQILPDYFQRKSEMAAAGRVLVFYQASPNSIEYRTANNDATIIGKQLDDLKLEVGRSGNQCGYAQPTVAFSNVVVSGLNVRYRVNVTGFDPEVRWNSGSADDADETPGSTFYNYRYTTAKPYVATAVVVDALGNRTVAKLPVDLTDAAVQSPLSESCSNSWYIDPEPRMGGELVPAGIPEIQEATNDEQAKAAALAWLEAIKVDPVVLSGAAEYLLRSKVDPATLVTPGGTCASDQAVQYLSMLRDVVTQSSVTAEQAPANGLVATVQNGQIQPAPQVVVPSGTESVRITLPDSSSVWVSAGAGYIIVSR